jgi:hypothetical protein
VKPLVVTAVLWGCAHAAPPWPKPSAKETDGGESLSPHVSKWVAVVDKEIKPTAKPDPKPDASTNAPADGKPAISPPVVREPEPAPPPAADEEGEETIVIEIDDE